MRALVGKLAYGALFCIALPAVLALWAYRLDTSATAFWPQPFPAWAGVVLLLAGLALMAAAMWALWTQGGGLPMNAYPTERFVSGSVYAFIAHPIYLGFVVAVAGASVLSNSPAGLWLVTPVVALGSMALVIGYEGPELRARFGRPDKAPWLGLPVGTDAVPPPMRRVAAAVSALGPWAVAYSVLSSLPAPQGAPELHLPWEAGLPRPEWALWLHTLAYVPIVFSPLAARTGHQLRSFVRGAWLATGIGLLLMLTLPGQADHLQGDYSSAGRWLAAVNRTADAGWLAFPSFHALWIVFAACALSRSMRRFKVLWWALACAIAASSLLTGSHALVDVLCGAALGALCCEHELAWRTLVQAGERLANSWSAVRVGRLRIISHALWSGTAGLVGASLTLYLAGPSALLSCGVVILTALLSAGAWGYLLEGGGRLSRPFGYYGFLLGTSMALAVMALAGVFGWETLAAAFAAAAPITQAVGRLRCIVQGCCHGRPTFAAYGFRVTHRMSRVTALANLAGKPIHPTQMYSIVGNVVLASILLRLWRLGADWTLIAGLYLVLASLARFAEEQYRGEPQTVRWHGLPIYQWLAIGFAVTGVALAMVHGAPVTPAQELSYSALALAVSVGLVAALLMSVDVPESERRFSRLTVSGT